jgi:CheY-like chemotaxis protein/HPt (histidine-containing phosphotransfer) domain-containing protein
MRAEAAADGPWALQALYRAVDQHDRFALALVDARMPGMDGEAVFNAMLADPRLAATHRVMLTPLGVRPAAPSALAHTVTKPVRRDMLRAALCQLLSDPAGATAHGPVTAAPACLPAQPLPTLSGRVLVAEDNITNQEVAIGMLRKLGLRADAVADGAEVVRSLESIPYNLVLMDMRMPVMDGLEATRRIRDPHSQVRDHAIPIVAMTANAMPADCQRCLDAGMNDFISKPVLPEKLSATLSRWLGAATSTPATTPIAPAPGAESGVYDRAGLLKRVLGDAALVQRVLRAFLSDVPNQIRALQGHLARSDARSAARQAHSIKGAAASIGGEALRALAFSMEGAADSGDLQAVHARLGELESQFVRLEAAIRADLAEIQAPPSDSHER